MNSSTGSLALPFRMPAESASTVHHHGVGWAGDLVSQVRKVARACAEHGRRQFEIHVDLTGSSEQAMDNLRIAANLFLRAFELATSLVGRARALLDPAVQAMRRRYIMLKTRSATLAA